METLVEAMQRLRAAGYTQDFSATPEGQLRCGACGTQHDPETMIIDEVVRFEGESNPDDEAILLAVSCACGVNGLFTSAYGASAGTADIAVLTRLPRS